MTDSQKSTHVHQKMLELCFPYGTCLEFRGGVCVCVCGSF